MMPTTPVRIWDLPTRLFHWLLVAGIGFSWFCAETGGNWMEWHERSGMFLLALLLFRIVWGFIGSDTARFSHFLGSPARALKHVRELGSRNTAFHSGHNPLGAWMVVALLLGLLVQGFTGLFATDDIMTDGPLRGLVSGKMNDFLNKTHHFTFNILLLLAAIHITAILYYRFYKRTNLIKAMVVGKSDWPHGQPLPGTLHFRSAWLGLVVFGLIYASVYFGVRILSSL